MSNGSQIDVYGKPKLADGRYHFKNAQGQESELSAAQVRAIAPASMAHEEQKTLTPPKPPKQRHWYFLWLARHPEVRENQAHQSLPATAAAPADFWAARLPVLLGLAPDVIASLGSECVGEVSNPS